MGKVPDHSQAEHIELPKSSVPTCTPAEESSNFPFKLLAQEITEFLGEDFMTKMPAEDLEAYCMRTIERNEPTGLILYRLMLNFLRAYSNPAKSDEAMKAFDFLHYHASESTSEH